MSHDSALPHDDVVQSHCNLNEEEKGNLGVVLGAYRSFRGNRRANITYVGMPITTGLRYYDVLEQHGVKDAAGLAQVAGKSALYDLVIKPNVEEGIALADRLGARNGQRLFIAPSVFEAKRWRWSQDAYMSLWYRVIGEMAGTHTVSNGWEYTTGGAKEALFTMMLRWRYIRPFNLRAAANAFELTDFFSDLSEADKMRELEAMRTVTLHADDDAEILLPQAVVMMANAIDNLQRRGFACEDLIDVALRMKKLPLLSPFCGRGSEELGGEVHAIPEFRDAVARIEAAAGVRKN